MENPRGSAAWNLPRLRQLANREDVFKVFSISVNLDYVELEEVYIGSGLSSSQLAERVERPHV